MSKLIKLFVLMFIIVCMSGNVVLAATAPKNPMISPKLFKPVIGNIDDNDKTLKTINKITGTISIIGSGVAIVVILLIGIKYVLGSVEEKAQYKETLKPYLIGCIMVFGIFTILKISQSIMNAMFDGM